MIELELFPLKYEVYYKDKTYIVEATILYTPDEVKWIVSSDKYCLTKNFNFDKVLLLKINQFTFNTKDEAISALKTHLIIEDKLQQKVSQYKEEIVSLKNRLELSFLYDIDNTSSLCGGFLSVHDIEAALNKKGCFRINKSHIDSGGVQVSTSYIHNMLILEKAIEEIAKENNCKVINIYNHDVPHCNHSSPLYYYWQCGNDFVRQFALLKHIF